MSISNTRVDLDALPRFEDVELQRLSPRYAPLVLGVSVAVWAMVFAGVIVSGIVVEPLGSLLFSQRGVVLLSGFAAATIVLSWFSWKSVSVIRYAVRDHDVIVQSGVFWRKETIQPIVRIQHVEQARGPLEKRFGLYTLKLFSAGTGHVTFRIPGLSAQTAGSLKRYLLEKTQSNVSSVEAAE